MQRFANSERYLGGQTEGRVMETFNLGYAFGYTHDTTTLLVYGNYIALQLDIRSWPLDGQLGESLPTDITRGMDEKE